MKSGSEIMEQIKYDHPLYPRYSAAMAVVGDELYIFGGKGNKYGKQELSTHYYLGLYAINLKSKQSRTIWEKKMITRKPSWLPPCTSNRQTVLSMPYLRTTGEHCGKFP